MLNRDLYPAMSDEVWEGKLAYIKECIALDDVHIPFMAIPSTILFTEDYIPCFSRYKGVEVRYLAYASHVGVLPFPPIPFLGVDWCLENNIYTIDMWFPGLPLNDERVKRSHWDWEFIYDSNSFMDMSGGSWETFRKNSRKWVRRKNQGSGNIKWVRGLGYDRDLRYGLIVEWLEAHRGDIYDVELLMDKLLMGWRRQNTTYLSLFLDYELKAIVVGEMFGDYCYFVACITSPGEKFLEEYVRWKFMVEVAPVLVNDGGSLDREGLYEFKNKLNPMKVLDIESVTWEGY
jgi:hypothetical protein